MLRWICGVVVLMVCQTAGAQVIFLPPPTDSGTPDYVYTGCVSPRVAALTNALTARSRWPIVTQGVCATGRLEVTVNTTAVSTATCAGPVVYEVASPACGQTYFRMADILPAAQAPTPAAPPAATDTTAPANRPEGKIVITPTTRPS